MKNEKILIVNDIAGAGKVASNVVFPLLSVAMLEPALLPTLLLSTNIDADGKVAIMPTELVFNQSLVHWEELGFNFTSFATGFFGSPEQISTFKEYFLKMKETNSNKKLFVDPIMGEDGELYPGFHSEIPHEIKKIVKHADIVLPNITEACLMTGHPYKEEMSMEELTVLAKKVNKLGAKNTILSGIRKKMPNGEEKIGFIYYDEKGNSDLILHKYFDRHFFGAGDIVFSLIISFYLYNYSIHDAIEMASLLTEQALQNTVDLKRDSKYGVYFESIFSDFIEKLII